MAKAASVAAAATTENLNSALASFGISVAEVRCDSCQSACRWCCCTARSDCAAVAVGRADQTLSPLPRRRCLQGPWLLCPPLSITTLTCFPPVTTTLSPLPPTTSTLRRFPLAARPRRPPPRAGRTWGLWLAPRVPLECCRSSLELGCGGGAAEPPPQAGNPLGSLV